MLVVTCTSSPSTSSPSPPEALPSLPPTLVVLKTPLFPPTLVRPSCADSERSTDRGAQLHAGQCLFMHVRP